MEGFSEVADAEDKNAQTPSNEATEGNMKLDKTTWGQRKEQESCGCCRYCFGRWLRWLHGWSEKEKR